MNKSVFNRLVSLIITSLFIVIGMVLLKGSQLSEVTTDNSDLRTYTVYGRILKNSKVSRNTTQSWYHQHNTHNTLRGYH